MSCPGGGSRVGPVSGPCRVLVVLMVAHLEWNCSRLRKLMKLSPGPVSAHPSSITRVLYHAAVVGAGLRGEGEERSGQEEEHLAPRSGCRVDVCDHCDCYMNHNVLPSSRQQVTVHW